MEVTVAMFDLCLATGVQLTILLYDKTRRYCKSNLYQAVKVSGYGLPMSYETHGEWRVFIYWRLFEGTLGANISFELSKIMLEND